MSNGCVHYQFSCALKLARKLKLNIDRDLAKQLRGSLPKSGPLDFATKNSFPSFFVGAEALVGIY